MANNTAEVIEVTDNPQLEAALQYAANGFAVFPVHKIVGKDKKCSCFKGEDCKSAGKHPAVDGWPELATTNPEQIRVWFETIYKGYNIGYPVGQ